MMNRCESRYIGIPLRVVGIIILLLVCFSVLAVNDRFIRHSDVYEIHCFDPSKLTCQYALTEFAFPQVDENWIPVSEATYDAADELISSIEYHAGNYNPYLVTVNDVLPSDTSNGEMQTDANGRLQYWHKKDEHESDTRRYYYGSSTSSTPCGYARTLEWQGTLPVTREVYEVHYEIVSFGRYDACSRIWTDFPCCMITDRDGMLEKVVEQQENAYLVTQVDEYGRRKWRATYDSAGTIMDYTLYSYQSVTS